MLGSTDAWRPCARTARSTEPIARYVEWRSEGAVAQGSSHFGAGVLAGCSCARPAAWCAIATGVPARTPRPVWHLEILSVLMFITRSLLRLLGRTLRRTSSIPATRSSASTSDAIVCTCAIHVGKRAMHVGKHAFDVGFGPEAHLGCCASRKASKTRHMLHAVRWLVRMLHMLAAQRHARLWPGQGINLVRAYYRASKDPCAPRTS